MKLQYWYITYEWKGAVTNRLVGHHAYEGSIADWVLTYNHGNNQPFYIINAIALDEPEYRKLRKKV